MRNEMEKLQYGQDFESVLAHMVKIISEKFKPIKIILFGSYASGTATYDSDIDLMVVMPDGTDTWAINRDIFKSVSHSPMPKDILTTTPSLFEERLSSINSVESSASIEGVIVYD